MPANKDQETPGQWIAQFYYTDWTGQRKKKRKRGFKTKKDALDFEREFISKHTGDVNMLFSSFLDIYYEDIEHRLRPTTVRGKKYMIDTKLLPYFGSKPLTAIQPSDVRRWQNEMIEQNYTPTYLKTLNNQLTAILNFAVKYYNLPENPCHKAGQMGKRKAEKMEFWTKDEFKTFIGSVDNPVSDIVFRLMYFSGMRIGELLALTKADFDFTAGTVSIDKTYQRIDGNDIITEPKTPKSKRVITLPSELLTILQGYFERLYDYVETDRAFPYNNQHFRRELEHYCEESGVKNIRLHDIRHSHASLLIEMGFSPLLIAERLGHENVETTLNTYSHLYPHKQSEVAEKLNNLWF